MMFNNACRTCHTIRDGDNRLAPPLRNPWQEVGHRRYYGYSSSMRSADIVWDEKNLAQFIADLQAVISGNNMKPSGANGDAGQPRTVSERF
jgi:cytochrome c